MRVQGLGVQGPNGQSTLLNRRLLNLQTPELYIPKKGPGPNLQKFPKENPTP